MRTALLAALSFVLCSSLSGASAPDWLQALAKKAPPEESGTPPAWVLLDETTVSINESGDTIEHRRVAVRLRTNSGSEFAKGIVYYNGKSDRVQTNKAWLVRNGSAPYLCNCGFYHLGRPKKGGWTEERPPTPRRA